MILLIGLILVIGMLLAFFYPPIFILYYGMLGSMYDARGIAGYFSNYLNSYAPIMNGLLYICMLISIVNILKKKKRKFNLEMLISICFLIIIHISVLLGDFIFIRDGNILYHLIDASCLYGPSIFIIWYSYNSELKKYKKYFQWYVILQLTLSFLIIYGSSIHINSFSIFNSGYYGVEAAEYYLDSSRIARLSNFYQIFMKKGYFLQAAQFHNSNPLGFYCGVGIIILISEFIIKKRNFFLKIISLFFCGVIFLLWCNSVMRGVIYAMITTLAIIFFFKKKYKVIKIMIVSLIIFLGIEIMNYNSIFSYFLGKGTDVSVQSRIYGIEKGIEFALNNFFIGNGGGVGELSAMDIDPHILPLKILVLYGIFAAILSFLLIFYISYRKIKKAKFLTFYGIGLIMIAIFSALTNNYTSVVLFWLILSEGWTELNSLSKREYIRS